MTTLPEFLQDCETLGLLRLIVTNDVAVLEVRTPLTKVFYAELPKSTETGTLIQHYANMHSEEFEFHLNMDKIGSVKFETGQAKRGNFTTYAIRFLTEADKPALSAFLQWVKPGEYAPGQVDAWQALKEKYGEVWQP